MSKAKLTLVGAGPGDPELISLKGVKALEAADVILYDALVHPALLQHARPGARLVYVGKRAGKHHYSQEEINKLIVSNAFQYGHVVRLKGGDPFIFGRGHEELEYARAFDIPVEIVPGISSSTALPALQEIPLTKRGSNESFWVVTASTSNGALSADLDLAAQSSATVVILMGVRKLREISVLFMNHGKGNTPVAIIQNGSMPNEKVLTGFVKDIADKAEHKKVETPAIIVIGEVVREHHHFDYERLVNIPASK